MKFFRVRHEGIVRVGVIRDEHGVLLPPEINDVVDVIDMGDAGVELAARLFQSSTAAVDLSAAVLLAPIGRFRRDLLCTGWNYWDHFEEGAAGRAQKVDRPTAPTFFTKSPSTVIGPNDPIGFDPRISQKWDYEAELVVVFGRSGRSIPQARAMEHVFGYCLANDVSQRDLQRRHGGQWLKGKTIDATMPLGPYIVTADEVDLPSVRFQCLLNGRVMQDATASLMAFPLPELIAELSLGMTIHAGEVLLTGTPAGVGNARTPPVFLKEGDRVEVVAAELGRLDNLVTARDLLGQSDVVIQPAG